MTTRAYLRRVARRHRHRTPEPGSWDALKYALTHDDDGNPIVQEYRVTPGPITVTDPADDVFGGLDPSFLVTYRVTGASDTKRTALHARVEGDDVVVYEWSGGEAFRLDEDEARDLEYEVARSLVEIKAAHARARRDDESEP